MNKLIAVLPVLLLLFWGCSKSKEVSPEKELFLKRISVLEGSSQMPHMEWEYKYSDGKVVEYSYNYYYEWNNTPYSSISINKYKYANNLPAFKVATTEKGDIIDTTYYEYNSQNQRIKEFVNQSGKEKKLYYEYKYNAEGQLAEVKNYQHNQYVKDVVPFYIVRYDYESNNVVKNSYYDNNGVLFGEYRIYYDNKSASNDSWSVTGKRSVIRITGTDKYVPINGELKFGPPGRSSYLLIGIPLQDVRTEYNQWGYLTKQEVTFTKDGHKLIYGYEY